MQVARIIFYDQSNTIPEIGANQIDASIVITRTQIQNYLQY
jgi:hypothetical protein